jgi:hypothetical protein
MSLQAALSAPQVALASAASTAESVEALSPVDVSGVVDESVVDESLVDVSGVVVESVVVDESVAPVSAVVESPFVPESFPESFVVSESRPPSTAPLPLAPDEDAPELPDDPDEDEEPDEEPPDELDDAPLDDEEVDPDDEPPSGGDESTTGPPSSSLLEFPPPHPTALKAKAKLATAPTPRTRRKRSDVFMRPDYHHGRAASSRKSLTKHTSLENQFDPPKQPAARLRSCQFAASTPKTEKMPRGEPISGEALLRGGRGHHSIAEEH